MMARICSSRAAFLASALFLAIAPPVSAQLPAGLKEELAAVAKSTSAKYNCSISIALKSADGEVSAAHGVTDFSTGRQALPEDEYPWGSVTKSLTGTSVMSLVAKGAFGLDDKVAPLVDPLLKKMAGADAAQNFTSLAELFGAENVSSMTVRELLAMHTGMPDFDTAKPEGKPPTDKLRGLLYAHPDHSYTPAELMEVPWVNHRWTPCKQLIPFLPTKLCYSSTNFMVLGLILAAQAGLSSWKDLDQAAFLPESLRGRVKFAQAGAPKDYTPVRGYDRTSYNMPLGQHNDHDNGAVEGVFSGWAASNIVASAPAVAELAWEIYGPPSSVAPKEFVDQMLPQNPIYGLATFNLRMYTGHFFGKYGVAYGHLGATYGYQSVMAYFPELKLAMSVATNIETDSQAQPAETLCMAYNAVVGRFQGKHISCLFRQVSYYVPLCLCGPASSQLEKAATAFSAGAGGVVHV